jgi:L-iditol 2-dehydrogenase
MDGIAKVEGGHGNLSVISVPDPKPAADEVVVSVAAAGLCGSDLGIYTDEGGFEFVEFPRILGHEYAGTVSAVGGDVDRFSVGDPVVEEIIRGCGDCKQCRTGNGQRCYDAQITGLHHHGAFAPQIAVPAECLHRLPETLALADAALVEPTAVAVRAVAHNSAVRAGSTVLVEGPGPIGALTALVARQQGATVVVSGVERDAAHRLPILDDLGFETVVVGGDEDREALLAPPAVDETGYDVVFDTTGHPSGLQTGADVVTKGGQIVLIGQTNEATLTFNPLVRGEIDIQCSYTYAWADFERAIDILDDGRIPIEGIVDDSVDPRDPTAAFEAALAGETMKPRFDIDALR